MSTEKHAHPDFVLVWSKTQAYDGFITHHSGEFGSAKMFLHKIFPHLDTVALYVREHMRAAYGHHRQPSLAALCTMTETIALVWCSSACLCMQVDTDTVFVDDPARLWERRQPSSAALYTMTENWCSCVMFIRMARLPVCRTCSLRVARLPFAVLPRNAVVCTRAPRAH